MDPNGNPLWAKIYGGTGNDEGSGVSQFNGSVYFTGSFNATANFDSFGFTSMASWDAVVAKLNPSLSSGLNEFASAENINAFPNPATFTLNISGLVDPERSEIYDVNGKLIKETDHRMTNVIDVSTLENGVYFLKIFISGEAVKTSKIVIAK
jgi:hypothetical protein